MWRNRKCKTNAQQVKRGGERGNMDWRRRGRRRGAVAMAMKAPLLCQELQDAPVRRRENMMKMFHSVQDYVDML